MKYKILIFCFALQFASLYASPACSDFLMQVERRQIPLAQAQPLFSNLDETVHFIADFQNEAEIKYGIRPSAFEAIELAKQMIADSQEFSATEKKQLVAAFNVIKNEFTCKTANWAIKTKKKQDVELELPPKMATGFMCILGGSLLYLVPGAQGVGLFCISSGAAIALEGFASGEVPYWVKPSADETYRTAKKEDFTHYKTIK